jgi:pimeloyl-ACP methyl ester carboxylesterase
MAKDSLVEVNGVRLHVREANTFQHGPTVVFLHDSVGCFELWRDFPGRLGEAAQCNWVLYERQGFGKSDPLPSPQRAKHYLEMEADRLAALLVRLKIKEPVLFGHSDGASISLIAAGKYSGAIQGVICEAGHVFVEQQTLDGVQKAVADYRNGNLKKRLEKYHGERTETLFRAWTETWLSETYRDWNIEHVLPGIVCPVLLIQGDKDEYGTLQQVESIATRIRGTARAAILPGIGHTPHKEAPAETLRIAAQFIHNLDIP